MDNEIRSRFPSGIETLEIKKNIRNIIPYLSLQSRDKITTTGQFLPEIKLQGNVLLKSYLGTGKTTQIQNLPEVKNLDCSILILSCRRTYALATSERFSIPCYLNLKKREIQTERRLIISMESLYKLGDNVNFDLIIGDEIESCLSQFYSHQTMKDKIKDNMLMFENLIRRTKRFIFADAFLSSRTLLICDMMNLKYRLWVHDSQPIKRTITNLRSKKGFPLSLIEKCIEKLREGRKVFFVSSTKKMCLSIEKYIKDKIPEIKMMCYNSDKKNDLVNINESWGTFDLILTTTTITVGINYDKENIFDFIFLYLSAWGPPIRDLFQCLMRVRHLTSNHLFYTLNFNAEDLTKEIPGFHPLVEGEYLKERIIETWDDKMIGALYKVEEFDQKDKWTWKKENYVFCRQEQILGRIIFDYLFYAYLKECGYVARPLAASTNS